MNETVEFVGTDDVAVSIHDVSHHRHGEDIDLSLLNIVHTAPALLTSAERLMLFTLVYCIRPERYIEIGVFRGGASLIVASAMDAVDYGGRMILVDREPQIDPEHWERLKFRSTLIQGDSPGILRKAREEAGGPFDFVFIDAGHSSDAVMRDATGVLPYLEDGAYMLFHDSYRREVGEAIDLFAQLHVSSIVDFGVLTREFSRPEETREAEPGHMSAGFRVLQFRKKHGRMRPVNRLRGLRKLGYLRLRSLAKRILRPGESA